jgi:hypothetical protein
MLEYLSKIQQKEAFPAYPPSLRYTDEFVDFLYSSVEKDVEWGRDRQDIYLDVEFLAAPRWIGSWNKVDNSEDDEGGYYHQEAPPSGIPPPIVKGTSFPRLRIDIDRAVCPKICCDFERRPHPPPYTPGPHPVEDALEEEDTYSDRFEQWYTQRGEWLGANSDTTFPPGIELTQRRCVDLNITDPEMFCEQIRLALGEAFCQLGDDHVKRLERVKEFLTVFPEWFLVKGATSS